MKESFRSRGIRLARVNNLISREMKVYFEPQNISIDCNPIRMWSEKSLIALFEYSTIQNQIDTYNYHVNLTDTNYEKIYAGLDKSILDTMNIVPEIFDISFRNYTVGYRLKNNKIYDSAYYFYPTIWKENRYGIKGIVDTDIISRAIQRFARYAAKDNYDSQQEILSFGQIVSKLKGVSVHCTSTVNGFKLYGRCSIDLLNPFILNTMGIHITEFQQYGDVVLVAQRITNGIVNGYNLYYKQ